MSSGHAETFRAIEDNCSKGRLESIETLALLCGPSQLRQLFYFGSSQLRQLFYFVDGHRLDNCEGNDGELRYQDPKLFAGRGF